MLLIAAAAVTLTGLSLYRNAAQGAYIAEMNTAAKLFFDGVNNYLAGNYGNSVPAGAPDNIYFAEFRGAARCCGRQFSV